MLLKTCVNKEILVKKYHKKIKKLSKLAKNVPSLNLWETLCTAFRYYLFCQLVKCVRIIQFVLRIIAALSQRKSAHIFFHPVRWRMACHEFYD